MKKLKPLNLAIVVPERSSRFAKFSTANDIYNESQFAALGTETLSPKQLTDLVLNLHDDLAPHVNGEKPFSSVTITGNDPTTDEGWTYTESLIHGLRKHKIITGISVVTHGRNLSKYIRELVALKPLNIVVHMDGHFGDPAKNLSHIGDAFMGEDLALEHARNNIFSYLSYADELAVTPAGKAGKINLVELKAYMKDSISIHSTLYGKTNVISKKLGATNFERLKELANYLIGYGFPAWHLSFELKKTPQGLLKRDKKDLPLEEMLELLTIANNGNLPTFINDFGRALENSIGQMPYIHDIGSAEENNMPLRILPTGHVRMKLSKPLTDESPVLIPGHSPLKTIGIQNLPKADTKTDTSFIEISSGYCTENVIECGPTTLKTSSLPPLPRGSFIAL